MITNKNYINYLNEDVVFIIRKNIPTMAFNINEGMWDRTKLIGKIAVQGIKREFKKSISDSIENSSRSSVGFDNLLIHEPTAKRLGMRLSSYHRALQDPTDSMHSNILSAINSNPNTRSASLQSISAQKFRDSLGSKVGISGLTSSISHPDQQQTLVDANHALISAHGATLFGRITPKRYQSVLNDPTHKDHKRVIAAHSEAQKLFPTEQQIRANNEVNPTLYMAHLNNERKADKIKQISDITQRVSTAHRFQPASRGKIFPAVDRFLQKNPTAFKIYKKVATII